MIKHKSQMKISEFEMIERANWKEKEVNRLCVSFVPVTSLPVLRHAVCCLNSMRTIKTFIINDAENKACAMLPF